MSTYSDGQADVDLVIVLDEPTEAPSDAPAAPAGWYVRGGKRVFDTAISLIALVLLTPVLVVLAAAVALSVGRPVVFSQTRVGRDGRPFDVYKFRTMHADRRCRGASGSVGYDGRDRRVTHKCADDPRLTRTGRVMRTLSLDELPQLLNVVRGEMSLVGPRPELPDIVERHYAPAHHRRHLVRPGMTGLWQITERGNGMMHEHLELDLAYVERIGVLVDLAILLRTIPAALGARRGF